MHYRVFAADFDGTLAHHGVVPDATVECLRRLRASGRQLVLITGRRLEPLPQLCPWFTLFERIVAENGAVLFRPETGEEAVLGPAPPPELIARIRAAGVNRVEAGRVVVATWRPHEAVCLQIIHELGLDLQITFNKDAVMLLPSGCSKASGLQAALAELRIAPVNAVVVGDAENDVAMMRLAGAAAAVDNALPAVKELCDIVTASPRGAGVEELCEMLLADDLASLRQRRVAASSLAAGSTSRPC